MIQKFISVARSNRKLTATLIPAFFSWVFTVIGVLILKDYGFAVFIFIPFFIGLCSTVIWGYNSKAAKKEYLSISTVSLLVYCAGLVMFAIEGIICIIMAAPLGMAFIARHSFWAGSSQSKELFCLNCYRIRPFYSSADGLRIDI